MLLTTLRRRMSGVLAGCAARVLATTSPRAAFAFGRFYRRRSLCYPRWLGPLAWTKTVRLGEGPLMRVDFRDLVGMHLILEKTWEDPEVKKRLLETLRPGDVFVDAGAHQGYYTLLASRRVGESGLVLAFEPAQITVERLAQNLRLNACENVILFSEALSDQEGVARISRPRFYNTGVSSLRREECEEYGSTPTAVRTLDSVVQSLGLNGRLRLVKIDVEGLELEVLRGMRQVIRLNPELNIFCELSPAWSDVADVLRFLSENGFRGERLEGGRWVPLSMQEAPPRQMEAWFSRGAR